MIGPVLFYDYNLLTHRKKIKAPFKTKFEDFKNI